MKLRIGSHTEFGITGERYYTEQDKHFSLLGVGGEWCKGAYAYVSIYVLKWRIEFYIDYQNMEDKWGYDELDAMADVEIEVDKVFNKLRIVKEV
jgi:hypothetical protein